MPDASIGCPLCGSDRIEPFAEVQGRGYRECLVCRLIHMEAAHRPDPAVERAHYETHRNDPGDTRYRAFLGRLADPLVARLPPGARGLDYGSGPGPTLAIMLRERGFPTELYDPFFAPHPEALRHTYDFVACTETAEHFFDPRSEFERLDRLLRPGGILAIMTETAADERPFREWRYARDPTHVVFYRPGTLAWIAGRFGWTLETPLPTVALFGKPR